MKKFDIPEYYRSELINRIKTFRKEKDKLKKDFSPTLLDFGPIQIFLARHFGFCYGVENAIEKSYRAIEENPDKKIYLISQMIHNPNVNEDLLDRGIKFILDTEGKQIIDWGQINSEDIVIIPAFGTTLEIEKILQEKKVNIERYNTTCPFVEKVWNKAEKIGRENYTLIIHGKVNHEETRATFSHGTQNAPCVIIRDLNEAKILGKFMNNEMSTEQFHQLFTGKISPGFNPEKDLNRVGIINQTTMLASETQEIADYFKSLFINKFGASELKNHYADTRDTLCYATNDNQQATLGLLTIEADLALVLGGYNSSNTSHLVELLEEKFPTYFINGANEFNQSEIHHYLYAQKKHAFTKDFLPNKSPLKVIITSGASCPDFIVQSVIEKIASFYPSSDTFVNVCLKITK